LEPLGGPWSRARKSRPKRRRADLLLGLLAGGVLFGAGPLVLPSPARAQVHAGDSVRVRLTGALRVEGMTTALRGDTLLLATAGLTTLWPVPLTDLESLEAYVDRSPRDGLRYGVALGAGAGLFAGALGGLGFYATGIGRDGEGGSADLMSVVLSWTGMGFVAGAIVGAAVGGARPGRGWVAVPLPRW